MPPEAVDHSAPSFELRYGLRVKPLRALQNNTWDQGVRLEQERIVFQCVREAIKE